jgi:hypothetical protein
VNPNQRLPILVLGAFATGFLVDSMLNLTPLIRAGLVFVASASVFLALGWMTGKRKAV